MFLVLGWGIKLLLIPFVLMLWQRFPYVRKFALLLFSPVIALAKWASKFAWLLPALVLALAKWILKWAGKLAQLPVPVLVVVGSAMIVVATYCLWLS